MVPIEAAKGPDKYLSYHKEQLLIEKILYCDDCDIPVICNATALFPLFI